MVVGSIGRVSLGDIGFYYKDIDAASVLSELSLPATAFIEIGPHPALAGASR